MSVGEVGGRDRIEGADERVRVRAADRPDVVSDAVLSGMGDHGSGLRLGVEPIPDPVIGVVGERHGARCGADAIDVLGECILPCDTGELVAPDPAVQIGIDRHLRHHAALHVAVAGKPVHEHARRLRDEPPRFGHTCARNARFA